MVIVEAQQEKGEQMVARKDSACNLTLQLPPFLAISSHVAKSNATGAGKYILPMHVAGEGGSIC